MSGLVLIVEDEADIMLTLRLTLQVEGYRVVGVSTGEEALAYFEASPPDVTVLDIGLPGIDGLEVVRQLRASPQHSAAKLIVSSAHASGDVRRLTEALRCSAYLTKPFSTEELLQTVRAVLAAPSVEEAAAPTSERV